MINEKEVNYIKKLYKFAWPIDEIQKEHNKQLNENLGKTIFHLFLI